MNRFLTGPVGLAVMVTLANAVKPVLVDDTAYLAFARQVAARPLDPYGGTIYWYTGADPKMEILCPPVLPYWLGLGIRLFGDRHPGVLKLWLFPFVLLLAWSLRELLRRFARGTEPVMLPLLMLSPAILPGVNLMLDVPAVALGLTAVVLFVRAVDRDSDNLAAGAAVVAALAMQTKYTALLVPPVLGWYAVCRGRVGLGVQVGLAAAGAFAGWELLVALKYGGQSHFLFHAAQQGEKPNLFPPLVAYLGCLAVGVGLYAGRAVGWPRWMLAAAAGVWVVGVGAIAVLPHQATIIVPGKLALAAVVWRTAGTIVLFSAPVWAIMLLVRRKGRQGLRRSPESLFVVGWVGLEVVGYFVLTPFPAARRVIGPTIALGLLAARLVSRVNRARPDRKPVAWVLPFGAAVGYFVAGIDLLDAQPEKRLAEQAVAWVRANNPGARVWFAGHWGFQYYCERAGMLPLTPGAPVAVGDYVVLPAFPDDIQFYRPDSVNRPDWPLPGVDVIEKEKFVWDDRLSAQTIPNFYGGDTPVSGRDHPRLRVVVYKVVGVKSKPPG